MKRKYFFIPLFTSLLLVLFISCDNRNGNKQEKNNSANISKSHEALKEINSQFEKALYSGDYETMLKFYADDVTAAGNFHPTIKGKTALREEFMKQQKDGVKYHAFHAIADRMWEDEKEIYEYGSYGLTISSNQTKHPYAFTGSYFMIWEKQKDNSILIKYMISNLDFNPCKDFY